MNVGKRTRKNTECRGGDVGYSEVNATYNGETMEPLGLREL